MSRLIQKLQRSSLPREIPVVDLTRNQVTDDGVASLVRTVQEERIQIGQLRLQGNPLREPLSLVDLLRDAHVGLPAGFLRAICLSPQNVSCETFWRLLEVVFNERPRPALAIFFDDQLGELEDVVKMVETRDAFSVKVRRVPTLPGQAPPDVLASDDTDVVLFIDQRCSQ